MAVHERDEIEIQLDWEADWRMGGKKTKCGRVEEQDLPSKWRKINFVYLFSVHAINCAFMYVCVKERK